MRIYKLVGIVLSALLLLVSCTNSDVDKKKVKIAYANWLEGIAMSHLAKVVLEEHGYEVELQNADLAPIFVSMSGKPDIMGFPGFFCFPGTWRNRPPSAHFLSRRSQSPIAAHFWRRRWRGSL